jgi:hypothetical protein
MDLITMIFGVIGALAGAVVVRVIASDIGDNVPVLAKRLIILAAKLGTREHAIPGGMDCSPERNKR